ncbi:MAG: cytochrome C [Candidatus Sedimenticola endophacoides]|nr:MAG: cytochrome C [Candidatus Sedimenticola endophacoides]
MTSSASGERKSRKRTVIVLVLVFMAGIVFTGLFNMGLSATNEMDFCISCHSMKVNYEEYKETVHYKNASGVRATCSDCHVPRDLGPKLVMKVLAYNDVLHEFLGTIDTPEKYEAQRWAMANRVWDKMRASNSRECRSCHDFEQMDLSEQGRSARKRHGAAMDEGKACIDCHKGLAHEEPDEPEEPEETTSET